MSSECASRGQEDEGEATMVEAEAIEAQAGAKCVRCKVNDATEFLRIALCRACFVDGVVTKFRMMLRGITRSGRVVVAYSGGKASRTVLKLLYDAMNVGEGVASTENGKKRTKKVYTVHVVHVDERGLREQQEEDDVVELLRRDVALYGWQLEVVPLEAVYTDEQQDPQQQRMRLSTAVKSFSTLTAQEDFISSLRLAVLRQAAKQLACGYILTGECADVLAARVLSLASIGRGATLPNEVASEDQRFFGVTIIRAMRAILRAELDLYMLYENLSAPMASSAATADRNSIARLTEDFISGLQAGFPSTVDNVLRTSDKIEPSKAGSADSVPCPLCLSIRQESAQAWRESIVVRPAHFVEKSGKACDGGDCLCSHPRIDDLLCYSCSTLWRERLPNTTAAVLPPFVNAHMARPPPSSSTLRDKIADFLLDD